MNFSKNPSLLSLKPCKRLEEEYIYIFFFPCILCVIKVQLFFISDFADPFVAVPHFIPKWVWGADATFLEEGTVVTGKVKTAGRLL